MPSHIIGMTKFYSITKKIAVSSFLISIYSSAAADTPEYKYWWCPFNQEDPEKVESAVCSQGKEGFLMSLLYAPYCNIDYFNPVLVCSGNGIPMYKRFTEPDQEILKTYIETDEYKDLLNESRYLRAYKIDLLLNGISPVDRFMLLQHGHFYDSADTYKNPIYYSSYQEAAQAVLDSDSGKSEEIDNALGTAVKGMWAYAAAMSGDIVLAQDLINQARSESEDEDSMFFRYLGIVEDCLSKMHTEECQPDYPITFSER